MMLMTAILEHLAQQAEPEPTTAPQEPLPPQPGELLEHHRLPGNKLMLRFKKRLPVARKMEIARYLQRQPLSFLD
jgi:hypothetical protein